MYETQCLLIVYETTSVNSLQQIKVSKTTIIQK